MKKILFSFALLLASQVANAYSYTIEITEDELQSRLAAIMPMERQQYFLTVVLSEPDIDLSVGNNEIGVSSKVAITAPGGMKGSGSAKITGSLDYDPETHAFYFRNPNIVSLESEDIPPEMLPQIKDMAQSATSKILSTQPIYTLSGEDLQQKVARTMLKSIKVENRKLLIELEAL